MGHGAGKQSSDAVGFQQVNPTATGSSTRRDEVFRRYVEPEIEVLLRVAQTLTGSWADAEAWCRRR